MSLVIVRLIGGLGNQLFQYSAGRALAVRTGAKLALDLRDFETYDLRRYELGTFPIAATIATVEELAAIGAPAPPRSLLNRVLRRLRPAMRHYREPHYHYDPSFPATLAPVFLDGYWQSERYFVDIAEMLRRELTPRDPLEPENAEIAEQIDALEAVSVHVRRGDYVTNATTNAYHGTCSLEYYRAAFALVRDRVPAAHVFVFSDDTKWTRANLAFDAPTTYVSVNPADRGFRDMQLMSRCRHHVIANSSFSWWGAWLNPRPDKMVIAPGRWFAQGENDTRDLVPASWVKL